MLYYFDRRQFLPIQDSKIIMDNDDNKRREQMKLLLFFFFYAVLFNFLLLFLFFFRLLFFSAFAQKRTQKKKHSLTCTRRGKNVEDEGRTDLDLKKKKEIDEDRKGNEKNKTIELKKRYEKEATNTG